MYFNLKRVYLTLGNDYYVCGNTHTAYRLIKTTPKGYNLLNLKTSKCTFKRHIYPISNQSTKNSIYLSFYMPDRMQFEPYFDANGISKKTPDLKLGIQYVKNDKLL